MPIRTARVLFCIALALPVVYSLATSVVYSLADPGRLTVLSQALRALNLLVVFICLILALVAVCTVPGTVTVRRVIAGALVVCAEGLRLIVPMVVSVLMGSVLTGGSAGAVRGYSLILLLSSTVATCLFLCAWPVVRNRGIVSYAVVVCGCVVAAVVMGVVQALSSGITVGLREYTWAPWLNTALSVGATAWYIALLYFARLFDRGGNGTRPGAWPQAGQR